MDSEEVDAVSLDELEQGLRSMGYARGFRRRVVSDARAAGRELVCAGVSADRLRYRAEVCDCCGALTVAIMDGGGLGRRLH